MSDDNTNTKIGKEVTSTFCGEETRIIDMDNDTMKIRIADKKNKAPSVLVVLVASEDLMGVSFTIEKMVTTVGRSSRLADVYIKHPSISKSHFQLIKKDDQTFISDLKSTNKTYVNDVELTPYEKVALNNNDQIHAGSIVFKFLQEGQLETVSTAYMLEKAHKDSLTGLANRHALKAKGQKYFLTSRIFSLILFDVDNFKSINDTFGHLAGDFVLSEIAKVVMELVRQGDMVFRYGGDEFCIFTQSSVFVVKNIAERIREQIEKHNFEYKGTQMPVTVSVGFAVSKQKDKKWEDVYERADKAFYQAKKTGRNKVVDSG